MRDTVIPPYLQPIRRMRVASPPQGLRIAVIPDGQVHEGVPINHWTWVGKYLAIKKPDVIINLGDFTDFPSISNHNSRGSLQLEGARYKKDVESSKRAMGLFTNEIAKVSGWDPEMYLTLGNHEHRVIRLVEDDPKLEGIISLDDLKYEDAGWKVFPFLQPIVVGGIAFCLTPDHKVLTKDLKYIALGDIKVGADLLAFDEEGPYRTYTTSRVLRTDSAIAPTFAVTLSSGKVFKVTADHRWLVLCQAFQQWRTTAQLRIGMTIPKFFDEWEEDNSYESGWLAGMFDGKGWLSKPNSKQGGIQLGVCQNEGPTLKKISHILATRGINQTKAGGTCKALRIGGQSPYKLKLLGEIRPERLIAKFDPMMLGRIQAIDLDTIVEISPLGNNEIQMIETSSKTMIVEGYGHHNCHYFPSGIMGRPITTARALLSKLHMSAFAGHQQGRDIAYGKRADGVEMTAIISGCLTPDHKVLTSDLRYIELGNLQVGDKVVSIDENAPPRRRRFLTGTVTNIALDSAPVFAVTLRSGKVFKVTQDHQWFVKTGSLYYWKTTDTLRKGTRLPKLLSEWETLDSFDAGWLSGMYDGEGSLYSRETTGGQVTQLAISQKLGPTQRRIESVTRELLGYDMSHNETQPGIAQYRIRGGAAEVARVLGSIRPGRLLAKFVPEMIGSVLTSDDDLDTVESVAPLGIQDIVRSKIDKGTYIVEGYAHHNSFYQHAEEYLSPFTNNHWRGMYLLHEANNGSFNEMALSISYFQRRFGAQRG